MATDWKLVLNGCYYMWPHIVSFSANYLASSSPPSSLASPSASVGSMTAPQPLERGRKEMRTPDLGKFNGTLCAQTCRADRLIRFCKCKTTGENCCEVLTDQCVRTPKPVAEENSQGIREARPKISK